MSPRLRSTSAILVAFAVPLGIYLASLRGEVSYWDTADLQTVPYILGIPYPTGFPGYVLIGWVWSHAFLLGEVAWRLNVLNALACAGTAAALAALLISLGAATAIGFGAALAYGLASMPWKHATYVDVHPLAFCAVAWAAVYAFRWVRSATWFDAVACAVATAIALACDNSTALALPGLLFIAFGRRPPLVRAAVLIACSVAAVIAVYAYLPLRSSAVKAAQLDPTATLGVPAGRPFWNDGDPSTREGFMRVVTGSDFSPREALAGMMSAASIRHVVDDFVPLAAHDLGGFMPWLALFGGALLWWRHPLVLGGLVLVGLLPLLFAGAYVVESEATRYYLPAYFVLVAFAGYAVTVFDAGMHGMQRYALLAVIACAWAVLLGSDWYTSAPLFDQPHEPGSSLYIKRIAQITPKRAIVVVPWNYATPLAYGAYVLHSLGDRIVLTAGPHQYLSSFRGWMVNRPVVVISEDRQTFQGFRVTELDDGDPHVYALH